MRKTLSFVLTITTFILAAAIPITACLGPPPLSPPVLIRRADVIVRATALQYVKTPREEMVDLDFSGDGNIQFKVEEILKGEGIPATLTIEGLLSLVDDFNDHPVPYDMVRPGGRHGSCEVYIYKKDAEFLLFLRKEKGKLTPYWASESPTNEQLRSPDDAWLKWVKEYLQMQEERECFVIQHTASVSFSAIRFTIAGPLAVFHLMYPIYEPDSGIFQPLTNSQSMNINSPKNVYRATCKSTFGKKNGPKVVIR